MLNVTIDQGISTDTKFYFQRELYNAGLTQDLYVEAVGQTSRCLAGEDPCVLRLGIVYGKTVLPFSLLRSYRPAYTEHIPTVRVTIV